MSDFPEHAHPLQEPDTLSWKIVVGVGVGLILFTTALALFARWLVLEKDEELAGSRLTTEEIPEDQVRQGELEYELFEEDGDIRREGERLRDREREHLRTWGWVSRETEVVHMPIDVAMQQVVQEGGSQ